MTNGAGAHQTRRAVLGAALGGAAAVAAASIRPLDVRAADNDNALLGASNTSSKPTSFENTDASETSLVGLHISGGIGVRGTSQNGPGVLGVSAGSNGLQGTSDVMAGVYATSGDVDAASVGAPETGVYGFSNTSPSSNGLWGESVDGAGIYGTGYYGVYGYGGIAIQGDAGPSGVGVYGWTGNAIPPVPPAGVGVYARAETTSQIALMVQGKFKMSRSGRLTMSTSSHKFTSTGVSSSSLVFVTLQSSVSGLYVKAVAPTTNAFTVYLSKSPGKTVSFSYMILNG